MFKDRIQAGLELSKKLADLDGKNILVLAISRGGVPVANEIAKTLQGAISLIIVSKLPFPNKPNSEFGALAEDGNSVISNYAYLTLSADTINNIVRKKKNDIKQRLQVLRGGHPLPEINNRTIILVDDGIAVGSRMHAAIRLIEKRKPETLIVAAPISSPEAGRSIEKIAVVDQAVILEQPRYFKAVSQAYEDWRVIPDHEVLSIISS